MCVGGADCAVPRAGASGSVVSHQTHAEEAARDTSAPTPATAPAPGGPEEKWASGPSTFVGQPRGEAACHPSMLKGRAFKQTGSHQPNHTAESSRRRPSPGLTSTCRLADWCAHEVRRVSGCCKAGEAIECRAARDLSAQGSTFQGAEQVARTLGRGASTP